MSMADHETATDTERRLRMTGTVGFKISAGVAYTGVFIGGMFWTAGGVDWVRGWVYLGLISVGHGLSALYVRWKMPGLLGHRGRVGKGTKAWDMVLLSVFLLAFWSILIVAALDHRFGGSTMSGGLWPVGAAIFASSLIFATWAMSVNPHFEKTVRIQADRDHRVIDTGPYRIVRHPGYLGFIPALSFAPPFLLGSWWAFIPAPAAAAVLILRTALEDRLLRRELPGYEAYTRKVPYRLLPGLW